MLQGSPFPCTSSLPSIMSTISNYPLDPSLASFTIRNLPLNRRQQLSNYLNCEQILHADCGLARDYRGIAQQLELPYSEIAKLEKMIDPFGTMLSYQGVSKKSVLELLRLIEHIGRYDVLDDLVPGLVEDLEQCDGQKKDQLLLYDPSSPNPPDKIWYDAYICYADSDLPFVQHLADYLESPTIGFRLFIRDRDLLGGTWVYETFANLIESQCRRVVVILSPEFLLCSDCKFQSQFATGLAIEKRSRILIPVIYKQCNLPAMIRLLSKIDMSGGASGKIPEWSMSRLVRSIEDVQAAQILVPQSAPMITYPPSTTSTTNSTSNNIIELTTQMLPSPNSTLTWDYSDMKTTVSTISSLTIGDDDQKMLISRDTDENSNRSTNAQEESGTQKNANRSKDWFSSFKRKMKVKL